MTSRRPTVDNRPSRLRLAPLALLPAVVVLSACASAPAPAGPDGFPLDPREELTGPFPAGVEKGWRALLEGDAARAEAAFESARAEKPRLAADIGRVEAIVLAGHPKEALPLCEELLAKGEPTPPLLVACGEARARSGNLVGAHALYRHALARGPARKALAARAEELRGAARDQILEAVRSSAAAKKWKEARLQLARALEIAPESPAVRAAAGDVEAAAGEKEKAFRYYREALELGAKDSGIVEKEGKLALELGDYATAVSAFDLLARDDSRYAPQAEQARLAFRVANWPAPERAAARSPHLTRAGAAVLVWWMYPEIREARVANGVIASDAVSRRDSRAITRAVALGLLDVDRDTHRVNPDAHLTSAAAARLLLRLLLVITPANRDLPCLGDSRKVPRSAASAIEAAQSCGLLSDEEPPGVSGPIFTRALDRVRALAAAQTEPTDD